MARAVGEPPARLDDPEKLWPAHAPATFAWTTEDIPSRGAIGAPPPAEANEAPAAKIRRVQRG
jgi:hypothetical protein